MRSFHCQTTSDLVFWKDPKGSASKAPDNEVSPVPAAPALSPTDVRFVPQDERSAVSLPLDCDLCEMIIVASKSEWVFEWIYKLRNWEKALQYEDQCHQLTFDLVSDGSIDRGSRVRDKLGILQTEMPAWTILDHIKTAACNRAKLIWNEQRFRNIDLSFIDKDQNLSVGPESSKMEQEIACGAIAENKASELSGPEKIKERIMKYITKFVEIHVVLMLEKLYEKLREEEEKTLQAQTSMLDQPRNWLNELTSINVQNGARMLFGPVGERPLHVCSLSAHRFGYIDFLGQGNYMKDGIISGMKRFLLATKDNWNEAHVGYGKDYCALISKHFNLRPKKDWGKTPPPFWSSLTTRLNQNTTFSSLGLYEGETVAYPMIASGDETSLYWILEAEKTILDAEEKKRGTVGGAGRTNSGSPSLVQHSLKGLFFLPMQRSNLTSFSFKEGWHYYFHVKQQDTNQHASSSSSYFGLSMLAFASSQEKVSIFDLILGGTLASLNKTLQEKIENHSQFHLADLGSVGRKTNLIRQTVLNSQDEYGNTMLHIAAKNAKAAMYDHLVEMGADSTIQNRDGLSPFTMTTRFGIWDMFNHIWDHHLTVPMWRFGNVEKSITNFSEFEWKGPVTFARRRDIELCLHELLKDYTSKHEIISAIAKECDDAAASWHDLKHKISKVNTIRREWCQKEIAKSLSSDIEAFLGVESNPRKNCESTSEEAKGSGDAAISNASLGGSGGFQIDDGMGEKMSGIRLITLFRPEGWYKQTRGKIEEVILDKWAQGFYLIHIGSSVLPYCVILLLFGLMWWYRKLHILDHNFWWADVDAVQKLRSLNTSQRVFENPVRANVSELEETLGRMILGDSPRENGYQAKKFLGPESTCGWQSIASSYSGRLQATLLVYGVPALLRLAYSQRRVRPSDLDEDENMAISFDELINFIYFNLESLLHLIMCGLFVTIFSARVSAGEECDLSYLKVEKNATSIASLFLFFNFFVVCKPYEGIGLLVLTIYKFLVSDVFNFLFMYGIFFVSFLLALQTLHNANYVYLSWMDIAEGIVPQVVSVTDNLAYLQNANTFANARLEETSMAIGGCQHAKRTLSDTAFSLLEISFGDGLADALEQARRLDYDCPGYGPDGLTGYLVVLWVFLTNVLVLNMLIAMMNYTFDKQSRNVRSVWILDVSYRIMRYERLFPELVARMQRPASNASLWNRAYWASSLSDLLLILYCMPEVHLWGYGHVLYVSCWRCVCCCTPSPYSRGGPDTEGWEEAIAKAIEPVRENVDRKRPGMRDLLSAKSVKIKNPSIRLELLSRSPIVQEDLAASEEVAGRVQGHPKEETRHALLLVLLIHELRLMQENFDAQRSVAKVTVLGGGGNSNGPPGSGDD